MCNLLSARIITSGGRNLPSSRGAAQHTQPTQENKTPFPEKGSGGSERPLPLQRQLRGRQSLGSLQSEEHMSG